MHAYQAKLVCSIEAPQGGLGRAGASICVVKFEFRKHQRSTNFFIESHLNPKNVRGSAAKPIPIFRVNPAELIRISGQVGWTPRFEIRVKQGRIPRVQIRVKLGRVGQVIWLFLFINVILKRIFPYPRSFWFSKLKGPKFSSIPLKMHRCCRSQQGGGRYLARSQKDAGSTALIGTLTAVYFGICEKKHSNVSSTKIQMILRQMVISTSKFL